MAQSHYPPKHPTPQYLEDRVWLKAFVGCGWEGKRALAHADKAVAVYYQQYACIPVSSSKDPAHPTPYKRR